MDPLTKTAVSLLGLLIMMTIGIRMVRWARKGNKGAFMLLAALFGMVADPTAQKQIETVQETRSNRKRFLKSGEPKTTGDEPEEEPYR